MGWAIQRADGTYRTWNKYAQESALRAAETWSALDTMPDITGDTLTPVEQESSAQIQFDHERLTKAVVMWVAGKLNIPLATARTDIKAIYKTLL